MRTSSQIRNLASREEKAWKVMDYFLSTNKKAEAKCRLEASKFILSRLYPEKIKVSGDEENPIKVQFTNLPEQELVSRLKNRISKFYQREPDLAQQVN